MAARKNKLKYCGPEYVKCLYVLGVPHDPKSWTAVKAKEMIKKDNRWEKYFTSEPDKDEA